MCDLEVIDGFRGVRFCQKSSVEKVCMRNATTSRSRIHTAHSVFTRLYPSLLLLFFASLLLLFVLLLHTTSFSQFLSPQTQKFDFF